MAKRKAKRPFADVFGEFISGFVPVHVRTGRRLCNRRCKIHLKQSGHCKRYPHNKGRCICSFDGHEF